MMDLDDYFSEDPSLVNKAPEYNQNQNNQGGYNNNYQNRQNNNNQYGNKPYNNQGGGGYNKGGYGGGGYNKGNFNGGGGGYNGNRRFAPPKEVDLTNFTMYKPVVLCGNPNVPDEMVDNMKQLGDILAINRFTLRFTSGTNLDEALLKEFTEDKPEIYIPWKDFNNIESKFYFNDKVAQHVAKMFNQNYDTLKPAVQAFLARNARMVLGEKIKSYALAVVIWSEDGAEDITEITFKTGNVGHIISLARSVHIPVFNLQKPDAAGRLIKYLKLKQKVSASEGTNEQQ